MFDADRVSALTFDSYSTIVDVDSAADAVAPYVDDPDATAALWRSHSLMYTFAANDIDAYEPFYDLNRHALTYALETAGVDVTEEVRDDVLSIYHDLRVFGDVREGMERLGAEYDLHVVSNGNPEMLDSMIDVADIGDLIEGYVSADEVATFKPDSGIYEHAAAEIGIPIDELAHVSAGWFDVQGAKHAGMQAIWADRKGSPWPGFDGEPDLVVSDFVELAEELGL